MNKKIRLVSNVNTVLVDSVATFFFKGELLMLYVMTYENIINVSCTGTLHGLLFDVIGIQVHGTCDV